MEKVKNFKRSIKCYVTCGVVVVFLTLMLIMGLTCGWSKWVNLYIPVMIFVMLIVTFNGKVTERAHSYVAAIVSILNIYIYSFMQQELYPALIIICSLLIMLALYMDWVLLIVVSSMSLVIVALHVLVLNTIVFATSEDVVGFIIRIASMIFSEVFLIIFVHRLYVAEGRLKASVEEARHAEHSKSDFLANMSHEIRTPMNAIVGMCELILREDISDTVRENCFNIQNSGRSLLAIINDILDFSKIESGKAELIEDEFNIGSTINDVMNMAITRKGEKKLEIIARIDPTLPKGLIGDEVRIKQIIVNLVTNAVKFTNRGCVILKITYNRHDYGINLNVSVRDTGIGITEENLEKLFTSFQQVDTRKNRAVEGTGLGLAISKRLVTQMGGFVNVSSVYGQGSEFRFVIPLKVSDPEPFIYVKDTDFVNAAVYVDMSKYTHPRIERAYRKLITELGIKFNVKLTLFDSCEEFKQGILKDKYTHCFTAKEEYIANKELFDKISEGDMEVMVIQDRIDAVALPGKIKCIYKPFYALSVAAVLNKENYILNFNSKNLSSISFTAPNAKILIVDDNITNLKVAEGLLKPYNMKIITVMSGMDAIEALRTKDYDLVLMDHMMPGMDGVEATRIIRQMEGEYFKKLPIIALTANAVNGVREMFLREGFNDFIAKPIELSLLARSLKTWLPKEHIVSSFTDMVEPDNVKNEQYNEQQEETLKEISADSNINYSKGLVYTGGNKAVYLEVLKVYAGNGEVAKESLDKRFEEENWADYVIEVHALKSSSLSVGAETLSELAKELELAGKEGNYSLIKEKHAELSELYKEVVLEAYQYLEANGVVIQDICEDEDTQELNTITSEQFTDYIERIKVACDNFDGDEVAFIADEMCKCSFKETPLKQYFAEVKKLAEDFEYEQAQEAAVKAASDIADL